MNAWISLAKTVDPAPIVMEDSAVAALQDGLGTFAMKARINHPFQTN